MGFFRGFVAPIRGAVFVSRERLWHLVVVPLLLNVALAFGSTWAALYYLRRELAGKSLGIPFFDWLALAGLTGLGAVVLFIVFQPLVGAIANDYLSERTERKVTGVAPRPPFLASSGRALVHALLKMIFYGLALVVGMFLTVATGPVVGPALGVALGCLFLAYDGFDYPLARRSVGFWGKWSYLALHPAQTIGYGLGATVFYLIPLALIVAPPFTAVGATLVFLETEKRREKLKEVRRQVNDKKNEIPHENKNETTT